MKESVKPGKAADKLKDLKAKQDPKGGEVKGLKFEFDVIEVAPSKPRFRS